MSVCDVCNNICNSETSEIVKCSACGGGFHASCVKEELASKKTRSSREWKCKVCRGSSYSLTSDSATSDELTKDLLNKMMQDFKNAVFGEIKSLRTEMADLSPSVKFMSEALDTSNKLMEAIKVELAAIKKENKELRSKNDSLTNEVGGLKERVRALEQYTRKNNLEISGVPVTAQENINDIVKDVGAALGVEIRESQVAVAHRVPTFRKDRNPSIVVQFVSRSTRDSMLMKFREKKTLNANQVNTSFTPQKVYVNEHLSPENKVFLAKLKEKSRDVGFAFAWCRDGKFFIRKSTGEKCIKISSYEELYRIK